jgi:hypothetical protein
VREVSNCTTAADVLNKRDKDQLLFRIMSDRAEDRQNVLDVLTESDNLSDLLFKLRKNPDLPQLKEEASIERIYAKAYVDGMIAFYEMGMSYHSSKQKK